jgi:hypothetical protein
LNHNQNEKKLTRELTAGTVTEATRKLTKEEIQEQKDKA